MFLCDNQLLEILNIFNTLKYHLEYHFLVEVVSLKTQHFHTNLPCQKPVLREIEWGCAYLFVEAIRSSGSHFMV